MTAKNMPPDRSRLGVITEAIARGETYTQIGKTLGVSRERIWQIVSHHGLEPAESSWQKTGVRKAIREEKKAIRRRTRLEDRERFIAPFIERVRNGESVNSISGHSNLSNLILIACRRAGVKSQANTRWTDFSLRREIVKNGLAKGDTWVSIAKAVTVAEGKLASVWSVCKWARRNLDKDETRIVKRTHKERTVALNGNPA